MVDSTPSSGVACWDADITAKLTISIISCCHPFQVSHLLPWFWVTLFSSSNIIIVAAIDYFVIACLCQTMGGILNIFMYYWVILTLCDLYVVFGRWNTREESINVEITVGWRRTLDWALYIFLSCLLYLPCLYPFHIPPYSFCYCVRQWVELWIYSCTDSHFSWCYFFTTCAFIEHWNTTVKCKNDSQ